MIDAPLALAFTAGLVATVNPCGFAMLPAYLSYFIGLKDDSTRSNSVGRGLVIGAVVSAGFLLVFFVAGILITIGIRSVIDVLPWVALVIGGLVAVLGVAMLFGFEPVVNLPKLGRGGETRGFGSVFVFGISYAIASLSCTLPVFLAVVAGVIPRVNLVSGVVTFLVYGLGMSLVLMAVTITLALGKGSLVGWLRRGTRYVNRVAGAILVVAGVYIVYFWILNISRGPFALSSPVQFVDRLSATLTQLIGNNAGLWGAGFAAVVAVAALYGWWRSRSTANGAAAEEGSAEGVEAQELEVS